MIELRFSPEAVRDLQEIQRYITEEIGSEISAKNTLKKITRRIQQLSAFPLSGSPLSAVLSVETDYRYLVCGNTLAFYRFHQNTVSIIRVLHGRRNYLRILFPETESEKIED